MRFEVITFINARFPDDPTDSDKAEGWRRYIFYIFARDVKMIIDDGATNLTNILLMFLAPYRLPLASFI